jgi:hypothetical protein
MLCIYFIFLLYIYFFALLPNNLLVQIVAFPAENLCVVSEENYTVSIFRIKALIYFTRTVRLLFPLYSVFHNYFFLQLIPSLTCEVIKFALFFITKRLQI